jgi:cell division control protein 45
MYYSTYLAPRLGIWRENGKRELNKLIAKLGIPLEEAQQKYRYMKVKADK